jgi:hypothetical protein
MYETGAVSLGRHEQSRLSGLTMKHTTLTRAAPPMAQAISSRLLRMEYYDYDYVHVLEHAVFCSASGVYHRRRCQDLLGFRVSPLASVGYGGCESSAALRT